jgi:hypothetical protein
MIFAQMPVPTSAEFAGWIVCLAASIWGANQLTKLVHSLRGPSPQPPSTELKGAIDLLAVRILALERLSERDTERRGEIYEKIDKVRLELTRDIKSVDQRMEAMGKHLPAEIVALLTNTGAIARNIVARP